MNRNRIAICLLITFVCVLVGACASKSPFADIDWDAQRIIREQQKKTLGETSVTAPLEAADDDLARFRKSTTALTPKTHNPVAKDLPVKNANLAQTSPDDEMVVGADPVLDDVMVVHLNLEDIIGYALRHSPEYRSQKEDLYLQTLSLISERHLWGPRFFDTVNAKLDGVPESGDHDLVGSVVNELRVTQRLPYGGDISVRALVNYVNYLRRNSSSTDPHSTQNASIGVSFNLPLLRGAGVSARESLIQAERDLVYSVREFERFRRQFLVDLCTTYFDLLLRQKQIETERRQLVNLQRLADRFDRLSETGREPYFEYERAQAQVLFGQSNLQSAIDAYALALDRFKIDIGMPTIENLVIDRLDVVVPEPFLDSTLAVQAAYDYRLDLQTQFDQVDDARRAVNVAKNGLLPSLDLSGSLDLVTDPDRDRAGLAIDAGASRYSVGAELDLPLDRKIERSNVRASLIRFDRAQRNYKLQRDRIALEVRNAIRDIEQARFNLRIQESNVKISERRLISVKLRERTLGPRDVIEALESLSDAENRRDRALTSLRTSILNFLLTTGQMRVAADGRWESPGRLVLDDAGIVSDPAAEAPQENGEPVSAEHG
ncbi:TolC family protein [Poriferisphaera sp. WC338]|uniref:TolC family protein n=1 Tax=Poriferisphaera sp. WC338 TaxID=3425129 RepID=UPI003D8154B6